jgi:hypothetical protein
MSELDLEAIEKRWGDAPESAEAMHEWLEADAVQLDIPADEIVQRLAEENKVLSELVAHARTDLPALVAEVRSLRHGLWLAKKIISEAKVTGEQYEAMEVECDTLHARVKEVEEWKSKHHAAWTKASDRMGDEYTKLAAERNSLVTRVKRLENVLKIAHALIVRHHDNNVQQGWGVYCSVCHRQDGTEPEMDAIKRVMSEESNHA